MRKLDGETPKTFLPTADKPAQIPTKFCSAIPTSIIWLGNSFPNCVNFPDPLESLVTTIMSLSFFAKSNNVSAKTSKLAF